jgi:hypothetical protein
MGTSDATTAAANGPGKISDVWPAFVTQVAKMPAGPAPDANVAVAYALGWSVGEALTATKWKNITHLAKVPGLSSPAERWKLLVDQITSSCKRLQAHLKDVGADASLGLSSDEKWADLGAANNEDDLKAKEPTVGGLNTSILEVLWSVEPPLGQAYLRGQEMEQMCATPVVSTTMVMESVKDHNDLVHKLLNTLASKLPANAAHATDNSLRLWWAWLGAEAKNGKAEKAADEAEKARAAEDLLEQGRRWREVLAGEVAAQDRLRLSDYVAAADSVTGKLQETAWQVAKRFWVGLLIALALAGGGIYLIAAGTLGVGITSVIAAFGLTWKGIGEFFGRAAAKAEQKLWDAEIDWAVAYRFTILRLPGDGQPRKERSRAIMKRSRDLKGQSEELNWDKTTTEHMRRYMQWKDRWPDVRFTQ